MAWYDLLWWVSIAVLWAGIAINAVSFWRNRRLVGEVHDTARLALDALDAVEQSRDPGRDVHDRLARSFEARLILTDARDQATPDPALRRAAAQTFAAQVIEDVQRANLALVDAEPDAESHP